MALITWLSFGAIIDLDSATLAYHQDHRYKKCITHSLSLKVSARFYNKKLYSKNGNNEVRINERNYITKQKYIKELKKKDTRHYNIIIELYIQPLP